MELGKAARDIGAVSTLDGEPWRAAHGQPGSRSAGAMSEGEAALLEALRESAGAVTARTLAGVLGVTPRTVQRRLRSLRRRGCCILNVPGHGYRLAAEPLGLSLERVAARTGAHSIGRSYHYYGRIGSTNAEAKSLAVSGAPHGTVVVAEEQTAGRGRLGRAWVSPPGKSLLFSVLLRPTVRMADAHLLTVVAACAVAEAIESMTDLIVAIRWPNDLVIGKKKVAGILTEVAGDQDAVEWAVIGIGINVNVDDEDWSSTLRTTATSLKAAGGKTIDRTELLVRVLLRLETRCQAALAHGFEPALGDLRRRDCLRGRDIAIQTKDGPVRGRAVGVDDDGALLIRLPGGLIRRFLAGDVTLAV